MIIDMIILLILIVLIGIDAVYKFKNKKINKNIYLITACDCVIGIIVSILECIGVVV